MSAPTPAPAGVPVWTPGTPEYKLAQKIRVVCHQIARGQLARWRRAVLVYYGLRIVSISLTALAGAGLVIAKADKEVVSLVGWPFWGAMVVVATGIAVQVADLLGVEKTATHARAVADICDLAQSQLRIILALGKPASEFNDLVGRVIAAVHDPSNHPALPADNDPQVVEAASALADEMVRVYNQGLPPAKQGKVP